MLRQSFISILFLLLSITAQTQTDTNAFLSQVKRIKDVPSWYTSSYQYKSGKEDTFARVDAVYTGVVKSGTKTIMQLVPLLSDTSLTGIPNTCTGGYFTFGQLAFFLINDIEPAPYALVTKMQWHVYGECGILPTYFLNYLRNDGVDFQSKYKAYWDSKERKDWLKRIGKGKKSNRMRG